VRTRGFFIGLAGGIVGAALVLAIALVSGLTHVTKQTVVQQTGTATAPITFPAGTGLTPAQLFTRSAPGVVEIKATFGDSQSSNSFAPSGGQAVGSGFVVSTDGYILTNQHVVVDENSGQSATSVTVGFKSTGSQIKTVVAKVVGADASSDVALLQIDPKGMTLQPLSIGNSDTIQVGEPVVAIGNPLQLDFSITSGIVSAVDRDLNSPNGRTIPGGIQTDAAINPGNSGGPLIDSHGQVIGINEQIASQGGGNEGLGFAVPINLAVKTMAQLKQFGTVKYAWMGIQGQTVTADLAQAFKLPVSEGVLLAAVETGQPADKAGLRGGTNQVTVQGQQYTLGGDIITALDGHKTPTIADLVDYVGAKKPGDVVTVSYLRDGKPKTVKVTLASRPANM
jgi:S1-C subfamily serine protease